MQTASLIRRRSILGVAVLTTTITLTALAGRDSRDASFGATEQVATKSDRANPRVPSRLLFASPLADGLKEFVSQIHPERVSVVDDPTGRDGNKVLKFKVFNSDTGPTSNPRAQLETPSDFKEGDDRYAGFSYLFPREFPSQLPRRGWVTLGSIAYGRPYGGAAPVSIRVQNNVHGRGAELRWQRNSTYGFDTPWQGPRVAQLKGRWVSLVVRIKLHRDPRVGFVELWMNTSSGWKQQRLAGKARLHMRTYDTSNDGGPNNSRLGLYYRRDIKGPLTVYQGGLRIASAGAGAFRAVAPNESG